MHRDRNVSGLCQELSGKPIYFDDHGASRQIRKAGWEPDIGRLTAGHGLIRGLQMIAPPVLKPRAGLWIYMVSESRLP